MTFLEAAVEILKRERKPLHYKKLTQIALDENLLTVVGKTPELTMQQRLNDALKKNDPSLLLTREKPGVFGLRWYPPPAAKPPGKEHAAKAPKEKEEKAPKEGKEAKEPRGQKREAKAAEAGDEDKKKKRRRGGRGRRRGGATTLDAAAIARGEVAAAEEPADEEEEAAEETTAAPVEEAATDEVDQRDETTEETGGEAHEPAALAHGLGDELEGETEIEEESEGASIEEPAMQPAPSATDQPEPSAAREAMPLTAEEEEAAAEDLDEGMLLEEIDTPSGPLIAPAFGTEELVRGEEHRPVYEERRDRRHGRDRDRDRRGPRPEHGRPEHGRPEHGRQEHGGRPPSSEARGERPGAPPPPSEGRPVEGQRQERPQGERRGGFLVDAVVDVLNGSDGRPMHVRQIVDIAIKRRLMRGDPPELWRNVRVAIIADQRAREMAGLRVRVRPVGGGHYLLIDRKLDPELAQAERALAAEAQRISDQSLHALRRRVGRLQGAAFETLCRLLLERMGVGEVELVKRGEGVTYYGGVTSGTRRSRLLIAMRAGEAEYGRRAVAELRAGLKARNFDDGLLLTPGRANAEAQAELATGGKPLEVRDSDQFLTALAHHGVGVIKRAVAVELLDVELLGELSDEGAQR